MHFLSEKFAVKEKSSNFALEIKTATLLTRFTMIGLWCNGNTADSGPAFPGSSPGSPTKSFQLWLRAFFIVAA